MTCIVGYVSDDGITYLGGDSLGSNGYSGMIYRQSKVFHCKDTGNAVIGYTSSFRMGQLLMYAKNLFDELSISKDEIDHEYMVTKFVPKLQELLSNGGYEKTDSGRKSSGEFLLGYKDKLYNIQTDYSVLESLDKIDACGSGEEFALGALHAVKDSDLSPEEKLHTALRAASKFSVGVAPPFYIVNTKTSEVVEFAD